MPHTGYTPRERIVRRNVALTVSALFGPLLVVGILTARALSRPRGRAGTTGDERP